LIDYLLYREAEMRQILDLERLGEAPEGGVGDSQSLYFTPAGTPLREALFRNGSDIYFLIIIIDLCFVSGI
jgi:hypothetical protein